MPSDDGWVTWPEAAEIVGCPLPTIDWYSREGRIEKRPFRGRRPTLKRTSVEEFARWWTQRSAERERRRALRHSTGTSSAPAPQSTAPTGHVSAVHAAEVLGVTRSHVYWLVSHGHLDAVASAGRVWVSSRSVAALVDQRTEQRRWMSIAEAAELVGCSDQSIERAARRGEITRRNTSRQLPSLDRASVEAFKAAWADRRLDDRRGRPRGRPSAVGPPDTVHQWLTADEAATILGVSARWVGELARADRLPNEQCSGRRWYRADLVQLTAHARRARRAPDQPQPAVTGPIRP